MAELSNVDKLKLERAGASLKKLHDCKVELETIRRDLPMIVAARSYGTRFPSVSKNILKALDNQFVTDTASDRFKKAADFGYQQTYHGADLAQLKSIFAESADILNSAIEYMEAQVSQLKGVAKEVVPAPIAKQPETSPAPEPKKSIMDYITIKPTLWGMSIDVKEAWKNFKKK